MYNRLFTKILDSSIWLEADATRIVWITLLAAMDEDGYAHFSCNENLAHRANVSPDALEIALKILESPDKFNPEDEFQGRRIERVTGGGWLVLKAPYYRTLLTREIAREKTRLRVQKHRHNLNVTNETLQDVTVTKCNTSEQSIAEANKEKEKEKEMPVSSFSSSFSKQSKKLPAPYYPPLPPKREVNDEEWAEQQRIAKEAADKFRAEQQAKLRSA
jgi:hypothetical protein